MKRRLLLLAAGAFFLIILLRPSVPSFGPAPHPRPAGAPLPSEAPQDAAIRDRENPIATRPIARRTPVVFLSPGQVDMERPGSRVVPVPTAELVLFLKPGADPAALAKDLGIRVKHTLGATEIVLFSAATPEASGAAVQRARTDPRVAHAFPNVRTFHVHCAFVPDDPYFPDASPAPFHGQWHLGNGASPFHANLAGAWNRDYTGSGVLIGIVDDCLETAHPDLAPGFILADSWNFAVGGTEDPNPNYANDGKPEEDRHGTSVAGVAAARGGNGIGTTGAAPLASLAGLRIDFPNQTSSMFINATTHHSSGGNTNIKVKNHSYGYSSPYVPPTGESTALITSANAGTIHLFAAGNERGFFSQDSNKQEPQNSPHAIAVAALGSDGTFSFYSSFGANIFVTAPSNGVSGFGILTTDRIGPWGYCPVDTVPNPDEPDPFPNTNYTSTFGGTSSATPLAAGIVALGKQVRPALDVRFAKHALARSSRLIDAADSTSTGGGDGTTAGSAWKTNAAGFRFNQNYGFGLIDADEFVTQLLQMDGVGPLDTDSASATVNTTIPNNNPTGITRNFNLAKTGRLEEVLVTVSITHPVRGDLEGYLTSPSGTTRRLWFRSSESGNNINWTYVTNEFWGESPTGQWSLRIADFFNSAGPDTGTWNSYTVTARIGTELDSTPPAVLSSLRADANPTTASSVNYTLRFTEPVQGVDASDFTLTTTGTLAGTSITSVTGGPRIYTVTANTGTGSGTLRLDLVDNDSIQDHCGNKLGGTGVGNGTFLAGEEYTIDRTAPAVVNVSSATLDGAYNTGTIPVTVTFAETVVVTGTPQLRLATGGAGTLVNYASGSGTTTLTFNYSIAAGHNTADLDYSSTGALTLNGGTIRDGVANNAVLTLPAPGAAGSLGANKNLVIDTTLPQVMRVKSTTPNGSYGVGAVINVTVDFTEPVTLAGGNLLVTLDTGDIVAIPPFGPAASAAGAYTVGAGDGSPDLNSTSPLALSAGTLRDPAGNNCTLTIPVGQRLADLHALVIDTTAPQVTGVGSTTPNGSYGLGAVINVTVGFNETVTLAGGNILVALSTGDVVTIAPFGPATSASGTYTVGAGDTSPDLNSGSPLTLSAGTLRDAAGNDCVLTVPANQSLADVKALVIDSTVPQVLRVRSATADGTYGQGAGIDVTVEFTEAVTLVGGNLEVTLSTGDVVSFGPFGPATFVSATYTVGAGDNSPDLDSNSPLTLTGGTLRDGAGNTCLLTIPAGQNLAALHAFVIDTTPPSVTINQAAGQSDPANAGPFLFTVVFSETVTDFTAADVSFAGSTAGGTLVANISGTGPTYTVSVSGMTTTGTVQATIVAGAAADSLGLLSTASTSTDNIVTFNSTVPTVTINQGGGQVDPTAVASVVFDVVFSEAVNGFTNADISFTGSSAGGTLAANVTGTSPGTIFTVTVTGMTSTGTIVASIPAGAATSVSTATASAASTSLDNQVTYDITPPTVTVVQAGGQADPTNGASIAFTVQFSEQIQNFTNSDVSFAGSTVGGTLAAALTETTPGTTFTVTVTGMTGNGVVLVSIPANVATDLAGHLNAASTSTDNSVTRDITVPTVTITQANGQADPTNGTSIVFSVVFSETVQGFGNGEVSFTGSTVGGSLSSTVAGSGTDYTVTVTGMTGSGTVVVSVPAGVAADLAGNPNAASTPIDNSVTRDVAAPTVTVNQEGSQADPTNGSSIVFTVVFSETVAGFDATDVSVTGTAGATTAAVSGAGPTYTVTVTGMATSGTVIASIGANKASDPAGNGNVASTSTDNVVNYDITPLTVTIVQKAGQLDPTNGSPILFTVTFNKSVSNFGNGDVTLSGTAGATTATVTGSGTSYEVAVSGMTVSGTVVASIAAGVASDAAGNPNAASTTTDDTVTYDGAAPTVTVNQAAGQADPAKSQPILFTAVFSETVNNFTGADVVVGGTAGGTASVTGGPTTYTISVSGLTGDGTVTVSIPANGATDGAGNGNQASTTADNTVTYDATAPLVTQVSSTTADGIYGSGSIVVTIGFSEPVVVAGTPQLTLETGAADAVVNYTSGSGTNTLAFTYTIAAGHVSADLDYASISALALNGGTIRDAAGNDASLTLAAPGAPGSLGANRNLVVDTTPPVTGTVNDGWSGPDIDTQASVTTISANWSGFSDPESGITGYEWAIGTAVGGTNILPFASVGLQTSASTSAVDVLLALSTTPTYFVTIRATNGAGLTSVRSSDGVKTTGTGPAPAPPAAFYAVPSDQEAILEWLPSPTESVTYRVWWKPAAGEWFEAVRVDVLAGVTVTIPGLTNGTPYDFMIKAVDPSQNESAGVFANATPLASITIGGLGDYGTIQAALDAAVSGETVLVGPGAFLESVVLPPGVSLAGSSPVHTILTGSIAVQGVYLSDGMTTISNLTVTGGPIGVDGGTADVYLHHVVIHQVTSHGASSAAGGRLQAVNCTLMSNGGDGILALGIAEARNLIVGKNVGAGLNLPAGATINYNLSYANGGANYPAGAGGTGNLTTAAIFVDEVKYIELPASPSVDTGDPGDLFSSEPSPNGARINKGAFGNTRWAASKGGKKKGGGGGGGCGLTGLDALGLVALLALLKRRKA